MVAACAGTACAVVFRLTSPHDSLPDVLDWWTGDSIAIVVLTPLLLVWRASWLEGSRVRQAGETLFTRWKRAVSGIDVRGVVKVALALASLLLPVWAAFRAGADHDHLLYLFFIPIVWIAARLGMRSAVAATATLNAAAMFAFHYYRFPPRDLVPLQLIMLTVAMTGLLLGSVVSEHKQARSKLEQADKRLRSLLENMKDMVTVLGSDGTILYEVPSGRMPLGYVPGSLVHRSIFELIHPSDLAKIERTLLELAQTPGATATVELRIRHRDGTWRLCVANGRNLCMIPASVALSLAPMTSRRAGEPNKRYARPKFASVRWWSNRSLASTSWTAWKGE